MNTSLCYIAKCGPEPDVSDHRDLQRWDKWMAWHRRYAKFFPGSNGVIREDGWIIYDTILKSQRTRQTKEGRSYEPHSLRMRRSMLLKNNPNPKGPQG